MGQCILSAFLLKDSMPLCSRLSLFPYSCTYSHEKNRRRVVFNFNVYLGKLFFPGQYPEAAESGKAPKPKRVSQTRDSPVLLTLLPIFYCRWGFQELLVRLVRGKEWRSDFACPRASRENRWHIQNKIVQGESIYKEVFTKRWLEASTVLPGGSNSWGVTSPRSKETRDWRSHQSSEGE